MLQLSRFHRTKRVHDIHIVLNNDGFQIIELCVVFVFRSTNEHLGPDRQEKGPILICRTPFVVRDVDCRTVGVRRLHLMSTTHSHFGVEQGQADNDLLYALHGVVDGYPP